MTCLFSEMIFFFASTPRGKSFRPWLFCIALLFGSVSHLSQQPAMLILTDHPITVLFFIFLISARLISPPAPGPDTQKLIQAPATCAEFSDQRSQPCEIHIDLICFSVFARNRIKTYPISNSWGDNMRVHMGVDQ